MRALSGGRKEPSAEEKSPHEESRQREEQPSEDIQSHQQLFKQSIVGRFIESEFASVG